VTLVPDLESDPDQEPDPAAAEVPGAGSVRETVVAAGGTPAPQWATRWGRAVPASRLGMEESPDHGTDVVEEAEGAFSPNAVDGAGNEQDFQVRLDLFGGAEGDAEVIRPVFSGPPVPLGKIGSHRAS